MTDRIAARRILDQWGHPIAAAEPSKNGRAKSFLGTPVSSFWGALQASRLPASIRAADPLNQHAWVYSAAMVTAVVAAQAPFRIFRETDGQLENRKRLAMKSGGWTGAAAGPRRKALLRHASIAKRMNRQGIEPDEEHPLNDLLQRPNPLQVGNQLFQCLVMSLRIRGEAFWVFTKEDGTPIAPGETPGEIWPVPPDCMEPLFETAAGGRLVGWRMRAPRWMPRSGFVGGQVVLQLHEVAQFKRPNVDDLTRGLGPFGAIAGDVEADLLTKAHARSILRNRAMPGGFITAPELDDDAEKDLVAKLTDLYSGENKSGKPAVLAENVKWVETTWSMKDLQALDMLRANREEELAALQTPPSVLGLENVSNYATALVNDVSFWTKGIVPILVDIEGTIDATLLWPETDDVFGMFDLSQVDAFRAGMAEKIESASALCSDRLHCPPRIAYAVVGLDVPNYEGDEDVLVSAVLAPLSDVLSGEGMAGPAAPLPVPEEQEEPAEDLPDDEDMPEEEPEAAAAALRRKASAGKRWRDFVRLETRLEGRMRKQYRAWIDGTRRATMRRFDEVAGRSRSLKQGESIDLGAILPDMDGLRSSLRSRSRPVYATILDETFRFTAEELGGIPLFEVDDKALSAILETREGIFLQKVPQTVFDNLSQALRAGLAEGESIQELRLRVGQVFDVASSSSKALTVARTETAAIMNGVRYEMFGLQGFTKIEWTTAGDEHVRPDHVVFGAAGPVARGFNFLSLVGKTGKLSSPGDSDGPPEQVINCRCTPIPVE